MGACQKIRTGFRLAESFQAARPHHAAQGIEQSCKAENPRCEDREAKAANSTFPARPSCAASKNDTAVRSGAGDTAGITGPGAAFRSIASERQGAGGDQAQIARKHLVVKLRSVWQQCLKPVTRGGRFSTAFGAHGRACHGGPQGPMPRRRRPTGPACPAPAPGQPRRPARRPDRRAVPRRRPTSRCRPRGWSPDPRRRSLQAMSRSARRRRKPSCRRYTYSCR